MNKVIALLVIVTVLHAAVTVKEAFQVVDDDLVEILTNKRVHIRLYDEFIEQNDRRPDQAEYDEMLIRYQDMYRSLGRHPDIEDVVRGRSPEQTEKSEEVSFWVFYALLGVAFLFTLSIVAYVLYSRHADPMYNF